MFILEEAGTTEIDRIGRTLSRDDALPIDAGILAGSGCGRTARANGSGGTDHGTAGAAFLLGGAVHGGRVLADWPGLGQSQLFEGRDVAPTLHVAALYKGIAAQHFGLDSRAGLAALFPDQAALPPAAVIRA